VEVNVPIQIPDLTVRKLVVGELESMFVALNHAHGQCLEGNPTQYFSEDPEEEKKHQNNLINWAANQNHSAKSSRTVNQAH